jgi:outer membrane autotransporter protein
MKNLLWGSIALIMVSCGNAHAEPEEQTFTGARIGVDISRIRSSLRGDAGGVGADSTIAKNGVGYRGYIGYDVQLGNAFVVGAEAGIGGGGKTVPQLGSAGKFTVKPGLTYDISARAGFIPVKGLLLYARTGYRWLRTKEATTLGGAALTTKQTERAWTYGLGAELQVSPAMSLRAEYNRTPYSANYKTNAFSIGGAFRF